MDFAQPGTPATVLLNLGRRTAHHAKRFGRFLGTINQSSDRFVHLFVKDLASCVFLKMSHCSASFMACQTGSVTSTG